MPPSSRPKPPPSMRTCRTAIGSARGSSTSFTYPARRSSAGSAPWPASGSCSSPSAPRTAPRSIRTGKAAAAPGCSPPSTWRARFLPRKTSNSGGLGSVFATHPAPPGRAQPARAFAIAGRRIAVPALFLLLLAGFAAGIWGSYRAAFPARGVYRVTGVFEARSGDTLMLVRHDVVPGLMDEMQSMAIFADSPERLAGAGLARGDRVRLTVRQEKDRLVAVEILKIR